MQNPKKIKQIVSNTEVKNKNHDIWSNQSTMQKVFNTSVGNAIKVKIIFNFKLRTESIELCKWKTISSLSGPKTY